MAEFVSLETIAPIIGRIKEIRQIQRRTTKIKGSILNFLLLNKFILNNS
jgi:hypothetical protein